MISRRRFLFASGAAALTPCVFAQEGPKQITVIVGYPAGGATDLLARLLADGLRRSVAPVVIVENRPGSGGRVAVVTGC